jgi:hypothetical protein
MSDELKEIEFMQEQQKAVVDTTTNLEGLIRKLAHVQQELAAAEHTKFSEPLSGPFSLLSEIHGELGKLAHMMELECNRLVNESSGPVSAAESENT